MPVQGTCWCTLCPQREAWSWVILVPQAVATVLPPPAELMEPGLAPADLIPGQGVYNKQLMDASFLFLSLSPAPSPPPFFFL